MFWGCSVALFRKRFGAAGVDCCEKPRTTIVVTAPQLSSSRLTASASAASEEPKAMSESAACAC